MWETEGTERREKLHDYRHRHSQYEAEETEYSAKISLKGKLEGYFKKSEVPGYAHAPFSPKFQRGLCSDGSCEYICHI